MIHELEKMCLQKNFDKRKAQQIINQIDVNQVFKDSYFALDTTLLTCATEEANYDMVELLLKNGANPNLVYGEKYSEENALWDLQYSSEDEETDKIRLEIVKLLLENGANPHINVGGDDLYHWATDCWQDDMGMQAEYRSRFIDLLEDFDS